MNTLGKVVESFHGRYHQIAIARRDRDNNRLGNALIVNGEVSGDYDRYARVIEYDVQEAGDTLLLMTVEEKDD